MKVLILLGLVACALAVTPDGVDHKAIIQDLLTKAAAHVQRPKAGTPFSFDWDHINNFNDLGDIQKNFEEIFKSSPFFTEVIVDAASHNPFMRIIASLMKNRSPDLADLALLSQGTTQDPLVSIQESFKTHLVKFMNAKNNQRIVPKFLKAFTGYDSTMYETEKYSIEGFSDTYVQKHFAALNEFLFKNLRSALKTAGTMLLKPDNVDGIMTSLMEVDFSMVENPQPQVSDKTVSPGLKLMTTIFNKLAADNPGSPYSIKPQDLDSVGKSGVLHVMYNWQQLYLKLSGKNKTPVA